MKLNSRESAIYTLMPPATYTIQQWINKYALSLFVFCLFSKIRQLEYTKYGTISLCPLIPNFCGAA